MLDTAKHLTVTSPPSHKVDPNELGEPNFTRITGAMKRNFLQIQVACYTSRPKLSPGDLGSAIFTQTTRVMRRNFFADLDRLSLQSAYGADVSHADAHFS